MTNAAMSKAAMTKALFLIGCMMFLAAPALGETPLERGLARCMAIPAGEYSTGMIFNSPGHATVFHRSRCLQDLAIAERDATLCDQVRERTSLLFDGSGVSPESCDVLVQARIRQDGREAGARDFETLYRLTGFHFARNGNGKDYDLQVETSGSMAGSYLLKISVTPLGQESPITIHEKVYPHGTANPPRRIWLPRDILIEQLGPTFETQEYRVLARLAFAKSEPNRFLYQRIPVALRESRLEGTLLFADLPPWQPEAVE